MKKYPLTRLFRACQRSGKLAMFAIFAVPIVLCFGAMGFMTKCAYSESLFTDGIEELRDKRKSFVNESGKHTLQLALDGGEKVRAYVTPEDWLSLIKKGRVRSSRASLEVLSELNQIFLRSVEPCGYDDRQNECQHILEQTPFLHLSLIDRLLQKIWRKPDYDDHSQKELKKQRLIFKELMRKAEEAIAGFEAYEPSAPPEGYTAT